MQQGLTAGHRQHRRYTPGLLCWEGASGEAEPHSKLLPPSLTVLLRGPPARLVPRWRRLRQLITLTGSQQPAALQVQRTEKRTNDWVGWCWAGRGNTLSATLHTVRNPRSSKRLNPHHARVGSTIGARLHEAPVHLRRVRWKETTEEVQ